MIFAAFYRNVNLGRPGAPTRTQLESAYLQNGAAIAQSFLVNGTLVFEAASARRAATIARAANRQLAQACGLAEPAFLRSLPALHDLVLGEPFADVLRRGAGTGDCFVTFLPDGLTMPTGLPSRNARGDLHVLAWAGVAMLSVLERDGRTPSSPNAFAEKTLGCRATTRVWNTLCRLVERHG